MSSVEKKAAVRSFTDKLRAKEEQDEGGQDVFYSNLYLNQDASAVEEDYDEPASGLSNRRRIRQGIAELHGADPPSNKDSALVNLIKLDTALLRINRKLLELELAKVEQGLTFGYSFTISATNIVHIDFVDAAENENVPVAINVPGQKLFRLTIWNTTGSAADIEFSINRELRVGSDGTILKAGESITLEFETAKIAKLNLATLGASSTVRFMAVI